MHGGNRSLYRCETASRFAALIVQCSRRSGRAVQQICSVLILAMAASWCSKWMPCFRLRYSWLISLLVETSDNWPMFTSAKEMFGCYRFVADMLDGHWDSIGTRHKLAGKRPAAQRLQCLCLTFCIHPECQCRKLRFL